MLQNFSAQNSFLEMMNKPKETRNLPLFFQFMTRLKRVFFPPLLLGMCVLAGCDFLPSVPGIGVARAHALVSKYRNIDRVSTCGSEFN
jgi:5'-3' exonuclease